ncbi:hypothetical protein Dimus_024295 [Dionaea muscipula]
MEAASLLSVMLSSRAVAFAALLGVRRRVVLFLLVVEQQGGGQRCRDGRPMKVKVVEQGRRWAMGASGYRVCHSSPR